MARYALNQESLFDRPWGARHPLASRTGRARRLCMALLLLILCVIIAGYGYITDSQRVRRMAESYLSKLVGGRVQVGAATLSVFEGLRLDDVKVSVDSDLNAADSLLFSAQTFVIQYDPRSMLRGQLEATQIVAQKPRVHLTEDTDTAEWNYQRLGHSRRAVPRQAPSGVQPKPMVLPEVLLRNARIEIAEVRRGRLTAVGSMAIDGQLTPTEENTRYRFELQSRGIDGVGPFASGSVALSGADVSAQLRNFEFDRDILSMLPADVRNWWQRHQLAGRVDIPSLYYAPARDGRAARFRIDTELNAVTLAVQPDEWMGPKESRRRKQLAGALELMSRVYRAAMPQPPALEEGEPGSPATEGSDALTTRPAFSPEGSPVNHIQALLAMTPLQIHRVTATFVFTQDGIDIKEMTGRVEDNALRISGRIDGYGPDAPVSLHIASLDSENIFLPAAPRYVTSFPRGVREVYDGFRPQGTCRLRIEVSRDDPRARPQVWGRIDVLNGRFCFDKFPYPLREVTGRIEFGPDPSTGEDWVRLVGLQGKGAEGGPNQNSRVTLEGVVGPMGPGLPEPSADIRITGTHISSEPPLSNAFPTEAQQAMEVFGAAGPNEPARCLGDFDCHIVKAAGDHAPWGFDTDIKFDHATTSIAGFPYPLRDLSGAVRIRDKYIELVDLGVARGAMSLRVNGRIGYVRNDDNAPRPPGSKRPKLIDPKTVTADLRVAVKNLPIDDDLLNSLPGSTGDWLRKAGAAGSLDVAGGLYKTAGVEAAGEPSAAASAGAAPAREVSRALRSFGYDLNIDLHDGAIKPAGHGLELTQVAARAHITRDRLDVIDLHARRAAAVLSAAGSIDLTGSKPLLSVKATARDVALDDAIHDILPEDARRSWDSIRPDGVLDAELTFDGPLPGRAAPVREAATVPYEVVLKPRYQVILKPRGLAVTPAAAPYRLENVKGVITISPSQLTIDDLTAAHGNAKFTMAGVRTLGPPGSWDLKMTGSGVDVDDDLRRALPPRAKTLFESLKLSGTVAFDVGKLAYREAEPAQADPTASASSDLEGVVPEPSGPSMDLSATVWLNGGAMEMGVPLGDVNGQVRIATTVRNGQVSAIKGGVDVSRLTIAGRTVKNFRTDLTKPAGRCEIRLDNMQAELAGGAMAGQFDAVYPADSPARYSLGLVLHNADVRELANETGKDARGALTASLSLEGVWGDPSARRGRGDVLVEGRELYRIPLVLGLLQVTNLSLPIGQPFSHGSARYSLDGQRVNFEQVEFRSNDILMTGAGHLDFDTKQVRMSFATDNPGGLKIPFLHDLWQGARQELLRINVRGVITQPKVEASTMNTFTTTIDEVFKGDDKRKD